MSLIFATQLTAVATLALAILALAAAVLAGLAFWKQSQEVGILLEQSRREAAERRMAQAARVFVGAPRDQVRLVNPYVKNASDFPVYHAQVWYSQDGGDSLSGPDDLGIIMPSEEVPVPQEFPSGAVLDGHAFDGPILTFADSAGIRWIRMPDGSVSEQDRPATRMNILARLDEPLHSRSSGRDQGDRLLRGNPVPR